MSSRITRTRHVAGLAALAAAAAMLAAPSASAQNTTPKIGASAPMASSLARGDRRFVEQAAEGGMAEVALGNMAQQKATNDQVKQFAARMVEDHGKANDELKQIAMSKGVTLPAKPDRSSQRDMDRLNKATGAEFDREYMKHMVDDHKKDVKMFRDASTSSKDADIKTFAGKTLPTLEEHLKMAEAAQAATRASR